MDWKAITQDDQTATNYQVLTGDRNFVKSRGPVGADPSLAFEAAVLKTFRAARSPEERRRVIEGLEALTKRLRDQL